MFRRFEYRRLALPALAVLAALAAAPANAQDWPSKPVRVVVAFAAGGSTDVGARLISQKLTETLGQQFVVENRTGAGGTVGTDSVAKSPNDGYTIMMGTTTTHGAAKSVYKNLGYDPATDFVPISLVANISTLIVANNNLPVTDLKSLIAYAKANPKKINYGSAGLGASQHMFAVLFENRAGVEMQHIPYRGGGPAMQGLIAGEVQLIFAPLSEASGPLSGNQIKMLAVIAPQRHPKFPNVAALPEVLPSYELPNWIGLFAPKGTPQEVVTKVNAAVSKALEDPELQRKFGELGYEPAGGPPANLAAAVSKALSIYPEVVRISGVTVQ